MATTRGGGKAGYHHGDLRNALIAAAVELAQEGGPERVVLREAARRVGVSPTAAYRHFAGHGDLLHEVQVHGQVALADSMARAGAEVPATAGPAEAAVLRTVAMGRGYIRFALENPGLYRSAFCRIDTPGESVLPGPDEAGDDPEYRAYRLLSRTLDGLVEAGRMRPEHRHSPENEIAAWSTVHGLALLILDGPLAQLSAGERDAVVERTLEVIVAGLVP